MDQPSNAEIMRRVDDLQASLREDFAEVRQAHERFVLREVYEARHAALQARVEAVQLQQEKDNAERRTDRRWAIGSIVIPLVIFAYQIISNLQGTA